MHYTIGKRRGFYVHGAHDPHFVIKQNKDENTITVGKREDLEVNQVLINNINMFIDEIDFICDVKLRFRSVVVKGEVIIDKKENKGVIKLHSPVYGVAIGQTAVFYLEDKLIGSGTIIEFKK
jgi:tRNA-specific 2-thiouridylase